MSAFTGRVCFAAVRSVFNDKKKLFIASFSQTLPEGLSEPTRPAERTRASFSSSIRGDSHLSTRSLQGSFRHLCATSPGR